MSQPPSQLEAKSPKSYPRCPRCRCDVRSARDYFCPKCDSHLDNIYRAEHPDPKRAKAMSRADIEREYEVAGHEFAPIQLSKARLRQLRGVER